mgnify:FL=1
MQILPGVHSDGGRETALCVFHIRQRHFKSAAAAIGFYNSVFFGIQGVVPNPNTIFYVTVWTIENPVLRPEMGT